MAAVLNRTTLEYRASAHTPDYAAQDWVINPDLSPVAGVPQKYWKLTGDVLSEMSAGEKTVVDDALAAAAKTSAKTTAKNEIDGNPGYDLRSIAKLIVDEINALRQWIVSFKVEVAAATSLADLKTRVASLPDMPDRTLAQAKTAYKTLIDGSNLDE